MLLRKVEWIKPKTEFFDWISELQFIGGTRDKSRKMAKESWTHVFLFILVSCLSIVHYLTRPLTRSHNIIFTRKIFTQNAAVTGVMSTNNACLCPPEIIFLESPVLDKSCVNLTSPFSILFVIPEPEFSSFLTPHCSLSLLRSDGQLTAHCTYVSWNFPLSTFSLLFIPDFSWSLVP